mgnify:CR=1 FL=1
MAHVIDFKEAGFESVLDELEWRVIRAVSALM